MTLNWEVKNICVVVEDWKINGAWSMLLSCIVVILLAAGYELLRGVASNLAVDKLGKADYVRIQTPVEERLTRGNFDSTDAELVSRTVSGETCMDMPPLNSSSDDSFVPRPKTRSVRPQVYRSILYGAQVFYSFLLMLVFMTYNGFLMLSVAIGAGIGYYYASFYFHLPSSKSASCH